MFERHDQLSDPLYVVTTVFNPARFRTRWKLYEDFQRMVEHSGAILFTAEIAFGERQFVLTERNNPHHLQLRTSHEIWHKENALNLLIQRLPQDWKYVATVDADITFARSDWANETLHQLQHHKVVQMWSEAQDLSPDYESIVHHWSFVHNWLKAPSAERLAQSVKSPYFVVGHPGYAWAWRRSAFDAVGGFIDWAIAGAGDRHMADALIGLMGTKQEITPSFLGGPYRALNLQWQARALRYIKKDIGLVPGKILHYWHGAKKDRQYISRWSILSRNKFNPFTDLKRDWQGLYQLVLESERQIRMRRELLDYFRTRNEDSV